MAIPEAAPQAAAPAASWHIRTFVEADRPALRNLFVVVRNQAFTWAPPGNHRLEDFDMVTEGERILVATTAGAGEALGFAAVWEPESFLHSLFVHPDWQGQGIGKALLAACQPYFTATPTLKCLEANRAARAFYGSQGWQLRQRGESADGAYLLLAREAG